MPPLSLRPLLVCLLLGAALPAGALAEEGREWLFDQYNDPENDGRDTATLIYAVPETDDVQVAGTCTEPSGSNPKFSTLTFGADIGDLPNGKDVSLRFSGGGFEHTLPGQIKRAPGEEGLSGVLVDIGDGDPLWGALEEKQSLDYLVPGYRASSLDLTRGRGSVKQFLEACRGYRSASPGQQAKQDNKTGDDEKPGGDGKDDGEEKESFESAKELGTVEAWEAFISNYPSGFRSDLARAYIKQLGEGQTASSPPPPPAPMPPGDDFPVVAGSWGGVVRSGPGQNYKKVGSLREGQQVTLMGRSDVVEDGFPWFKIAYEGGTGYQWGGILCSAGAERADLFKTCPAAAKAAPAKTAPAEQPAKKKTATGCAKNQIRIEGRCVLKQDAASFCGPGFRLKGNKCVEGFAEPKKQKQLPSWQVEAIKKGCRPGQGWNAQEGCHEND